MDTSDAELIERFRRGGQSALAQLAARWNEKAYALAYRLTLDADAAAEIRQLAMLRVYEGAAKFNGRAAFSTWLYRVVVNLCRDRRRRQRSGERVLRRLPAVLSRRRARQPSPAEASESAELSRRVADAVASLPRPMREVVVMRHYHGLPFGEIAEIVDVPVTTVKSRMVQGLRLLREWLEDVS
jgi:RNA polymerase sigma-70 factor (ECF subfamily)